MLEEFKKQYINKVINGNGFDDELNRLFERLLIEELDDDPEKMSSLIHSFIDDHDGEEPSEIEMLRQENKELREWKEVAEPKMEAIIKALNKLTGEELI